MKERTQSKPVVHGLLLGAIGLTNMGCGDGSTGSSSTDGLVPMGGASAGSSLGAGAEHSAQEPSGTSGGNGASGQGTPGSATSSAGGTSNTNTGEPGANSANAEPVLDSGRTVLRRLTKPEYDNTVRDLLSTEVHLAEAFTAADTVAEEGFDTLGAILTLPPVLFEQYEAAASTLIEELAARTDTDPQKAALLTCSDDACARGALEDFAYHAFRRPVSPEEVDRLMALRAQVDGLGFGEQEGMKAALRGVLLSPHFVFRVERAPVGSTESSALSPHELATRLSYLIWSSAPDDELLAEAEAGSLPTSLGSQLQRLLADPKATAFTQNFGGQWMGIRHMEEHEAPSTLVYQDYDEALRDAAKEESTLFFEELFRGNRPLTDFLVADYTFVNSRLRTHYGLAEQAGGALPGPGNTFAEVDLTSTPRRGFLTHTSFLMNSSHPGSTSPPRRGNMVLQRFLCFVIPPPPAGVEVDLPEADPGTTRREQLEAHSSDPSCAGCHRLMDPIGFGFENFDGIGSYRTEENEAAIDASGAWPGANGEEIPFSSPVELAEALTQDPRYNACVTEKLLTYGVGRSFSASDGKAYTQALARQGEEQGLSTWPEWINYIVSSEAFLTRRGEEQ